MKELVYLVRGDPNKSLGEGKQVPGGLKWGHIGIGDGWYVVTISLPDNAAILEEEVEK